jgi:urea transport system substrate-binding protein
LIGPSLGCDEEQEGAPYFDGFVNVGVLHSRTGTMAISENTVAQAELMAIREINAAGGLRLGDQRIAVVAIEEDGASDWPTFARKAEKLIERDDVAIIFGGWTSASRKALLPVVEDHDHLLFYPIQYEGQECSRNIFYAGATPNQQVEPALGWLAENREKRWFLVGSDYVYPRTANAIVRAAAGSLGAEIVGERYLPLGSREVDTVIEAISRHLPNGGVVINTLNGDTNVSFFKAMKLAGVDDRNGFTVMSFSAAEEEVAAIGPEYMEGTLSVWNFFHREDLPETAAFAEAFQEEHGLHRVPSAPAVSAYSMVYLWAQAVERIGTTDTAQVREALVGTALDGPGGRVQIENNHHLSQAVLLGQVKIDGTHEILEEFGIVEPVAWSGLLEESRGDRCDWTLDRPDAGRFRDR